MDEVDAGILNRELLDLLHEEAPWAAEQVEETVRQGKTIARDVTRTMRTEMGGVVDESKSLGRGKLAMTQDLTDSESLSITLEAVECLMIQPDLIIEELGIQLADLAIEGVSFVEPSTRDENDVRRVTLGIPQETRGRISRLLGQIRAELHYDS